MRRRYLPDTWSDGTGPTHWRRVEIRFAAEPSRSQLQGELGSSRRSDALTVLTGRLPSRVLILRGNKNHEDSSPVDGG